MLNENGSVGLGSGVLGASGDAGTLGGFGTAATDVMLAVLGEMCAGAAGSDEVKTGMM